MLKKTWSFQPGHCHFSIQWWISLESSGYLWCWKMVCIRVYVAIICCFEEITEEGRRGDERTRLQALFSGHPPHTRTSARHGELLLHELEWSILLIVILMSRSCWKWRHASSRLLSSVYGMTELSKNCNPLSTKGWSQFARRLRSAQHPSCGGCMTWRSKQPELLQYLVSMHPLQLLSVELSRWKYSFWAREAERTTRHTTAGKFLWLLLVASFSFFFWCRT